MGKREGCEGDDGGGGWVEIMCMGEGNEGKVERRWRREGKDIGWE